MTTELYSAWQKKWSSAQTLLHAETRKFNLQLKTQGSNNFLLSNIIDAVNLDNIVNLQKQYNKIFLLSEQTIDGLPQNVVLRKLPNEFYGCYYTDWSMPEVPIEKDFNCFLNRLDPIRQSWFYLLFDRGMLDRGHISFNLHLTPGLQPSNVSGIEMFETHHRGFLSSFDHIKDQISKIVPYKNFVDDNDLFSISMKSKIGVIVETYFERTDVKTLSEKTFRALQLPRPWLLFAATGCVDKLRSMGFDVYDDIVDHNYDRFDTSVSSVERQEAILSQLSQLINLEFTPELLARLSQGAEHNKSLLKNWNSKWTKLCLDKIHTTFVEALEN